MLLARPRGATGGGDGRDDGGGAIAITTATATRIHGAHTYTDRRGWLGGPGLVCALHRRGRAGSRLQRSAAGRPSDGVVGTYGLHVYVLFIQTLIQVWSVCGSPIHSPIGSNAPSSKGCRNDWIMDWSKHQTKSALDWKRDWITLTEFGQWSG
jgi:hypothetical protein